MEINVNLGNVVKKDKNVIAVAENQLSHEERFQNILEAEEIIFDYQNHLEKEFSILLTKKDWSYYEVKEVKWFLIFLNELIVKVYWEISDLMSFEDANLEYFNSIEDLVKWSKVVGSCRDNILLNNVYYKLDALSNLIYFIEEYGLLESRLY